MLYAKQFISLFIDLEKINSVNEKNKGECIRRRRGLIEIFSRI
jgi:hypothetical protein